MEPSSKIAVDSYVPLDRYLNLAEADLIWGMLQASGLEPRVRDEYAAGLSWHYIPALGGVRLEVPARQWRDAQDLVSTQLKTIDPSAEDRIYFQSARRRRRALGVVALFLIAGPLLGLAGLALALQGDRRKEGESVG
jgi:hypothetical protein